MKQEYITNSPEQTKKIGKESAKEILKEKSSFTKITKDKGAFVIALKGELGGGKTCFLQGFAKGLGIKDKILSPTFVILKKFKFAKGKKFQYFFHIDCYRIQKPKELLDLSFKEIISNPHNIIVIEWAERIQNIMPKNSVWIKFEFINDRTRKITWG